MQSSNKQIHMYIVLVQSSQFWLVFAYTTRSRESASSYEKHTTEAIQFMLY